MRPASAYLASLSLGNAPNVSRNSTPTSVAPCRVSRRRLWAGGRLKDGSTEARMVSGGTVSVSFM